MVTQLLVLMVVLHLVLPGHGHEDEGVAHQPQDEGDRVHRQGQRHLAGGGAGVTASSGALIWVSSKTGSLRILEFLGHFYIYIYILSRVQAILFDTQVHMGRFCMTVKWPNLGLFYSDFCRSLSTCTLFICAGCL